MNQKVTGFHLDHENHWVADLACGHAQHVRHDPPWQVREWVLTAEGRTSRLGMELNCVRCDEAAQGHCGFGLDRRASPMTSSWFEIKNVRAKIEELPQALSAALALTGVDQHHHERRPFGRDVNVVALRDLPAKKGLFQLEGQARLLHDLANIELQAMELGVRTLTEFPQAPAAFRQELADITLGEGRHLKLCLDGLEKLGFKWGDWNVQVSLLDAVSHSDSLIDRILIVHRYLEGSGLDAGESILARLRGVRAEIARETVTLITNEEVDHVKFGSDWYHQLCREQKIDAGREFADRMMRLSKVIPRRERIATELRRRAGFTDDEIVCLQQVRALR